MQPNLGFLGPPGIEQCPHHCITLKVLGFGTPALATCEEGTSQSDY